MNGRRVATGVLAFVACLAVSTSAFAQREDGPFAGLFAGSTARTGSRQSLGINWSAYGGYDDYAWQQAAQLAQEDPSHYQNNGNYGGLNVGLNYQRNIEQSYFSVTGSTAVRMYGYTHSVSQPIYFGSTAFEQPLGKRTMITGNAGISYASFYQFAPFLATDPLTEMPSYNFAAVQERSTMWRAGAGISQQISQHTTFEADGMWQRSSFKSEGAETLDARMTMAALRHSLTKSVGLHAVYSYQDGVMSVVPTYTPHVYIQTIDVGVDFNKALSFSRKTTMHFTTGTQIVHSYDDLNHLFINVQASLTHEFNRSWNTTAAYVRGSQFVLGIVQPLFSNSISGSVNGLVTTRMQLQGSVGWSTGTVGIEEFAPSYGSATASGRASFAVSRNIALYVEAMYYHYELPPGTSFALGTPAPMMGRRALMIGVNGLIPLINERSTRDSR